MLNTYEEILDNVSIEIQANNKTPTYQAVILYNPATTASFGSLNVCVAQCWAMQLVQAFYVTRILHSYLLMQVPGRKLFDQDAPDEMHSSTCGLC